MELLIMLVMMMMMLMMMLLTCWTAGSIGLLRLLTGPCWASIRPCHFSKVLTSLSEKKKKYKQQIQYWAQLRLLHTSTRSAGPQWSPRKPTFTADAKYGQFMWSWSWCVVSNRLLGRTCNPAGEGGVGWGHLRLSSQVRPRYQFRRLSCSLYIAIIFVPKYF